MTGSTQHSYAFMGFDSRLRLRHRSGSRHLKNSGTNPSGSELSVVEPILTCWGQAKCVILCDFPIKLKHSSKGEHNPLWKSPLSYHDCMILHMQLYIYMCIYIYIYTYWAEPSTFLYIHIYIYIHTCIHMWRISQAVFITALFQVCISGHIIASTSSVAASWGLWLLCVCCSELDSLTRRSRWQVLELEYVGKS